MSDAIRLANETREFEGTPMKRIALLFFIAVLVVAALLGFGAVGAEADEDEGFGNHNFEGLYEFHADGVVEVNGVYNRGTWEVGRFFADGEGNWTDGVEYSSLLSSSDESIIDLNFTFTGTYEVNPDGTGTAQVTVVLPNGDEINKSLWFVIYGVGEDGIANGFAGGHADADLGGGVHGNSRTHVGNRIETAD